MKPIKLLGLAIIVILVTVANLALHDHIHRNDEVKEFDPRDAIEHIVEFNVPLIPLMFNNRSPFFDLFMRLKVYGTGSHIVYKGKTYILTNNHICNAAEQMGPRGEAIVNGVSTEILRRSKHADLCLLKGIKEGGLEISAIVPNNQDEVYILGHPRGLPTIIRKGRILTEKIMIPVGGKIQPAQRITALAYPGNSGSPILSADTGRVIGVLFAGQRGYWHEPFIVPLEYIIELLHE